MNLHFWTIIIVGASGDLATKKIIPALYYLIKNNKNHINFNFIGISKENLSIKTLFKKAYKNLTETDKNIDKKIWNLLENNFSYISVDFNIKEDFKKLKKIINNCELNNKCSKKNRLVYMAIPSDYFALVTENLVKEKIIEKKNTHKVVYEKPFGHDLKSAIDIDKRINKILNKNQIFKVDHYLTKAMVDSFSIIRFTNVIFEPIWCNKFISHVEIIFDETIGIGLRGKFYDSYGALKDVVQNHIFQLLALVAMKKPKNLNYKNIEKEKADILKFASCTNGILGQYIGYLKEKYVKKKSNTETFAALKIIINEPRWQGVPFYIKTGKCLNRKLSQINIVFKKADLPIKKSYKTNINANKLSINISPDSGIVLNLNIQENKNDKILPANMSFCYPCFFNWDKTHSYEKILSDVINNKRDINVSFQEIKNSWLLLEQIKSLNLPLYKYKKNSPGPQQMYKIFDNLKF